MEEAKKSALDLMWDDLPMRTKYTPWARDSSWINSKCDSDNLRGSVLNLTDVLYLSFPRRTLFFGRCNPKIRQLDLFGLDTGTVGAFGKCPLLVRIADKPRTRRATVRPPGVLMDRPLWIVSLYH